MNNAARIETLRGVAGAFRLDERAALAVLGEVTRATARWSVVADRAGLDRVAIEQMAPAFEHEQTRIARELATE